MSAPTESRILADTGGLVVTDDGRRVVVIDRGTGPLTILAFVLGVVALVLGGFGLVTVLLGAPSLPTFLGIAFLVVGALVALAAIRAYRGVTRRRTRPLGECRPVAVLDRKLGLFSFSGGGLIPLDQVRFARTRQIGSSSSKLVAVAPGGTRVLKRGNPFDGGIGNADELLTAVVERAAQSR